MKKVMAVMTALSFAVALFIGTETTNAQITRDKYTHAGTCYAIEMTLSQARPFNKWKPWQRALFTVGVIGGGKEWYDSRHPDKHTAEWGDIAADAVGAVGGEGAIWILHKSF